MKSLITPLRERMKKDKKVRIGVWLLPVLLVAILIASITSENIETDNADDTSDVQTVNVINLNFSSTDGEVVYPGTIEDRGAATLRAESSGQITSVPVSRGATVGKGTIIATIENARERAAVAQAQAGVASAKANLARITGSQATAQTESLETAVSQAERDLENVEEATVVALNNLLATSENIAAQNINPFFNDPYSFSPRFTYAAELTESDLRWEAEELQIELQERFRNAREIVQNTDANDNLVLAINRVTAELDVLEDLLDTLLQAANRLDTSERLSSSDRASLRSSVASARSTFLSTISALNAQMRALENAEFTLSQAELSEEGGAMGTSREDRLVAEAGVQQAEAALQSAVATLEDTIVRAPVDGLITDIFVDQGDTVSNFQEVAQIERLGALEASVSVPLDLVRTLGIGQTVTVENTRGRIVEIAPSSSISRMVEVVISLDEANQFSSGQSVDVAIETSGAATTENILVPLTALYSTPRQQYIYTVEDDVLVLVPVKVGRLQGSFVEITEGLETVDEIVEDARGLSEGEEVMVL